ncbi:MAG: phosphatidate cytidylyltransferase [Anaerolineales bacterium]|nr:phosphatidate cytidylyltransferase [Anaerolineales bacterium]
MLLKRTLVSLVLLPIGLAFIVWGNPAYALFIALILGLAAWEYVKLFRAGGLQPASFVVIGGTLLLAFGRTWNGFDSAPWMLSLAVLAAMTIHLAAFERGCQQAGTDFGVTLGGVFYIGWIGAYLISLRDLPEGQWWVLTALPACWLADSGAYLVGSRIGRHKMTPRLSPKKSWEGYLAGIVFAVLGTPLLVLLWGLWSGPGSAVTPLRGAALGLIMGVLTILGDLGESMIKRQMGVKDSGNLLPGHGGAFDRVDSWLWAGVIGYYVITWLF